MESNYPSHLTPEHEPQPSRPIFDLEQFYARLGVEGIALLDDMLEARIERAKAERANINDNDTWRMAVGIRDLYSQSLSSLPTRNLAVAREIIMALATRESYANRSSAASAMPDLLKQEQELDSEYLLGDTAQFVALLKDSNEHVRNVAEMGIYDAITSPWLRPDIARWLDSELTAAEETD